MASAPDENNAEEKVEEPEEKPKRRTRAASASKSGGAASSGGRTSRSRAARTEEAAASSDGDAPAQAAEPPRLIKIYRDEVAPVLQREFGYKNSMEVPRLVKIVINIGLGEAINSSSALDAAMRDLSTITGQRPVPTKAKKSIANFRLREGMTIGTMVTLRSDRMWQFFDRLVNVALPRVRDFRGVQRESFDGRGNYTLGLREQVMFPEIDYNQIDRMRGMQIGIVTTAKTDEESRRMLELLGMPFVRVDQPTAIA